MALSALLALLAGCDGSGEAPAVTVRDSAGVRIVESRVPAWTEHSGWRLSERPLLEIGRREGGAGDEIGPFPGRELYLASEDGRVTMGPPPFGRSSSQALRGDRLVVGDQAAFEIGEYTIDGALERILRIPSADLSIGEADVARWKEAVLARELPGRRAALRASLDARTVPKTRPGAPTAIRRGTGGAASGGDRDR
ncbi:MAG: hypothetical protein ACE5HF_03225 [Gemmatimonadota bacterium]